MERAHCQCCGKKFEYEIRGGSERKFCSVSCRKRARDARRRPKIGNWGGSRNDGSVAVDGIRAKLISVIERKVSTVEEISGALGIERNHVRSLLSKMRRKGWVVSNGANPPRWSMAGYRGMVFVARSGAPYPRRSTGCSDKARDAA